MSIAHVSMANFSINRISVAPSKCYIYNTYRGTYFSLHRRLLWIILSVFQMNCQNLPESLMITRLWFPWRTLISWRMFYGNRPQWLPSPVQTPQSPPPNPQKLPKPKKATLKDCTLVISFQITFIFYPEASDRGKQQYLFKSVLKELNTRIEHILLMLLLKQHLHY